MTETLVLRRTIADPVQGPHYSLQDPKNVPVDIRVSGGASLSFDMPVTLRPGATLEAKLPGRGKDGTPACATVRPLGPWIRID